MNKKEPTDTASQYEQLLSLAAAHAREFLAALPARPVTTRITVDELTERLGRSLTDAGELPQRVIDELVEDADPGLVASAGPRYFGYVVGGSLPISTATEWLVSAWDQNASFYPASPAAAVVEEQAATWIKELLGLPSAASFGFTTGAQAANVVALAAARWHVLSARGWDVNVQGLQSAPRVRVLAGAQRHTTIDRALRILGFGTDAVLPIDIDDQGRMRAEDLVSKLALVDGPAIVCAQAGNVLSGAVDPLSEIVDAAAGRAWVHVDGAFGLWAAAAPSTRHLVAGVERADSWSVDLHKWLNVNHDSALVFVAHPTAHRSATGTQASYLPQDGPVRRDPSEWVLEFSRRARGFSAYTTLRTLGRRGVAELVERSCRLARTFAAELDHHPRVSVCNEVVLNQVLLRYDNSDERTLDVMRWIQNTGRAWAGPGKWHGADVIRVSFSSAYTNDEDLATVTALFRQAAEI